MSAGPGAGPGTRSWYSVGAIAESFTAPSAGTHYLKVTVGQWTEDDDCRFTLLVNGRPLQSGILFADGFESGSTSAWSSSVP
jgi:hypothetical protein